MGQVSRLDLKGPDYKPFPAQVHVAPRARPPARTRFAAPKARSTPRPSPTSITEVVHQAQTAPDAEGGHAGAEENARAGAPEPARAGLPLARRPSSTGLAAPRALNYAQVAVLARPAAAGAAGDQPASAVGGRAARGEGEHVVEPLSRWGGVVVGARRPNAARRGAGGRGRDRAQEDAREAAAPRRRRQARSRARILLVGVVGGLLALETRSPRR